MWPLPEQRPNSYTSTGRVIEGEVGQLTGTENALPVSEYEEGLTDPDQASDFVAETGIDALAVCIGNAYGRYPREPCLDFYRLAAIRSKGPGGTELDSHPP
jgi:fructose/tagatose bisphosphate aldolase